MRAKLRKHRPTMRLRDPLQLCAVCDQTGEIVCGTAPAIMRYIAESISRDGTNVWRVREEAARLDPAVRAATAVRA